MDIRYVRFVLLDRLKFYLKDKNQRDLDDSRHLGHILTSYHRSDSKIERKNADNLLDYTEFYKRCTQRGYGEFDLGDTIEVDVSDYEKIEYPKILQWLEDRV